MMNVNTVNNKTSMYGLYDMLYQGNMALGSIKMNKAYFSSGNTTKTQTLNEDALQYVTSIKTASSNLSNALKELSSPAFKKTIETPAQDGGSSTIEKDLGYAKKSVENLVKSYNDLYVESVKRSNDSKAQNLAVKMINISKTYSSSLSKIGIGFDYDGKMTIDEAKFNEALENGSVERFFTENSGKNYGFTNTLSRLADNVSRNTGNYVSKSEFYNKLTENFAYSSFGNMIQYGYYGAGLVFDYSF